MLQYNVHWPAPAQIVRRFKRLSILCSIWKIGETASLLRCTEPATIYNPVPQLSVGLLQIVVHDDLVMGTGLLGELELIHSLVQALAQAVYSFGDLKLALEHDVSFDPMF